MADGITDEERAETAALIERTIAHHVAQGRAPDCALIVWLAAQSERRADDVRAEMAARDDFHTRFLIEALAVAPGDKQDLYLDALFARGYGGVRVWIEALLAKNAQLLTPAACARVIAFLGQHNPNAKAFVLRPSVYGQFPAGFTMDISALPARDFPDLDLCQALLTPDGLAPLPASPDAE